MRIGAAQSLAAFVLIASACATTRSNDIEPTGGPDASVQLQVPEVLAWEPEGPYDLKLNIVNYTPMILMAVEPKVEASDVTVYRMDGSVACRTPRAVQKVYEKWTIKGFQAGQHWEVKRDLKKNCPNLEPGLYRYEANYRMNTAEALRSLYSAFLGPQGGKILVKENATAMKYEDLVATVENPDAVDAGAAPAASPEPAATPATASSPAATAATSPATSAEPAAAAASTEPVPSAGEIRTCVDKELADRGLNAYGDPKGTTYDGNPPTDEYGRILYVASRNPGIRRACKIPKF
jgi:hypothetical protein